MSAKELLKRLFIPGYRNRQLFAESMRLLQEINQKTEVLVDWIASQMPEVER